MFVHSWSEEPLSNQKLSTVLETFQHNIPYHVWQVVQRKQTSAYLLSLRRRLVLCFFQFYVFAFFGKKRYKNTSAEKSEIFVETRICKLCVVTPSRTLRVYVLMEDIR